MLLTPLLQAQGGGSSSIIMFALIFVVFYFFMIRPQAKKAKEQKKFADSMNAGEKIVTIAGIHGTITRANDDGTLQIEISRNTFMTIERSAVSMDMTQAARKKAAPATEVAAK
jgi:preprotein translocase subunit YajC